MKPVDFDHSNIVLAKDQPEYLPLPAWYGPGPEFMIVSCWKMTWVERIKILFSGTIWLSQLTFGNRLQPQLSEVDCPLRMVEE